MAYYIYKTCETCGGDGVAQKSGEPYDSVPCWMCGETGQLLVGEIPNLQENLVDFRSDLADALTTIIQKLNQILQAVT